MSRYQVLRAMGTGIIAACFIAFGNWALGVPKGLIVFMHTIFDYRDEMK